MEHILLLLAILALVKSVWVMSLWPGNRCVLVFGCICVVFIVSVHDCVIELGKPVFDRWISDYDSLLDLSLWAMADLLLTAFQCRVAMQYRFGGSLKFWEKMLLYCPPVIIFPVLFYLHFSFFLLVSWPEFRTRDRSVRCLYFGYSERGNLGSKEVVA